MRKGSVIFLVAAMAWGNAGLAAEAGLKKKAEARPAPMSAEDLGFTQEEIQGDPQYQKELETRSSMLQTHQVLGLITAVPLTTQFILGFTTADNVEHGSTDTGLHTTLGLATVALYGTTAAFSIFAPKPKDLKPSGATELHQILALIHGPLMILTPLVGGMINDRITKHQPIGELSTVHAVMASTLLASYLTSMTIMTFNF